MSRRREAHCYTDEAKALFELVSPDDLGSEQETLAATAALGHLANLLNELPDPLNSAAADIGSQDVSALMRPMPLSVRGHMLNHLGLGRIKPQKVPQALCRDIAARMHNGRPHDQWHAMWLLTWPVAKSLRGAATAYAAGADADTAADEAGLATCPDRVLRAALWAELRASCEDARLLAWAATQPWWLPAALSPEHGQAVLDAARAVIDASPSLVMLGTAQGIQMADDEAPGGSTVTPSAPAGDMVMDLVATEADDQKAAAEYAITVGEEDGVDDKATAMEMSPAPSAVDVLAWAVPARDAARAARGPAAAAVDRVGSSIADGRAPSEADLAAVHAYREALTGLLIRLGREVPELVGVDALGEVDAQLIELAHAAELAEQQQQQQWMDVLLRLQAVPGHDAVSAAVDRLHALIRGGDEDLPTDALVALRDLVEHVGTHGIGANVEHLSTLHRRSLVLPAELSTLPTAALVGQLSLASPVQDERPTTEAEPETSVPPTPPDKPTATEQAVGGAAPDQIAVADPDADEPVTAQSAAEARQTAADITTEPAAVAPTEPAPQDTADLGAEPQPTDRDVEEVVTDLIANDRLGLAAVIAESAELGPGLPLALRLAALARQIRSEISPAASRTRALLTDAPDLAAEDVTLTLAVPALLRTALAAGDHTAGALLANLAPRLDPHMGAVAEQVGQRALQGVLVGGALHTAVTDVADLDEAVTQARQYARDARRSRTLRFKRASDIAKHWLASGGLLGELLDAAENDDRTRHRAVSDAFIDLSDPGTLTKHLEQADRQFRGHSGKPLEGQGRQDLVTLAAETLDIVSGWLSAVSARAAAQTGDRWATDEVTTMRDAVRRHASGALAELDAKEGRRDKALSAAAAVSARSALTDVFTLLDTGIAPARELAPETLLTGELLKVPHAAADPATGKVTLPADVPLRALLDAAALDWAQAFTDKLDAEDYWAAAYLLDACRRGALPGATDLGPDAADRLAAARQASITQLDELHARLDADLRKARIHSLLSAEQDLDLSALMAAANPSRYADADLGRVREQLAQVARMLPQFKAEAAKRLQDRVDQLAACGENAHLATLARLIADGELSTAEELISSLESGHGVPKNDSRKDFTEFFPSVPDALSDGITRALLRTVETGAVVEGCPALDFAGPSPDARSSAVDALRAWMLARSTPVEGRATLDDRSFLLPALRLVGFDFSPGWRLSRLDSQRGKERRLVEITEVTYTGKPMVPDFGSALRGQLRVLVCWGQPSEDLLLSWVDQDPGQHTVIVAYFGTMPSAARRRLAVRALATDASVAVLDDAALAYLAAHGARQLDAAVAVLLPFTAVQPYAREKRSLVPPEMFYGRDAERRDVLNMRGTQIIYGGRGLGKSALLREAKAVFEHVDGQVGVYIDLKATEIGPNRQGADAVWPVLLGRLREGGVLPAPRARAAQRAGSGYDDVRAGIRDWLASDPQRQLLVLLDESDHFFERDAPHFQETNRLKDLGALPGVEGRVKVVFAGLHSVQRFAKVPNQTFKHLAQQPTVIGPLPPQYAYNLITRPLGILGYEFERDELVHRLLGYCSYQPFLLQMFAHRLMEHMHEKRRLAAGPPLQPPYLITRDDVDAVEEHSLLKRDIAETFSDTLNLDPRYYVIANVLAWHAHQRGLDARLNDRDLREECRSWWALGFEGLDMEGFRTYLQEMIGLGVLAQNTDGRGWHLRSLNTLRMIGSREQVEENLLGAADEKVAPEFLALASRRTLPEDKVTAPLTAVQVADVLGDHVNQVRVVLGSAATGIGHVTATLRAVEADLAGRYTVVVAADHNRFTRALVDGEPGGRRVVLSDLAASGTKSDTCLDSLNEATSMLPEPGVTRSVVLVCGPQQMSFWRVLLDRPDAEQVAVRLRRYDAKTLRVWALEDDRPFGSEEQRGRLLEITGGWPLLVDRAAALAVQLGSQDRALTRLEQQLTDPGEAAEFLEMAGITADPELAAALDAILSLTEGAPVAWADLVEAAAESAYAGLNAAAAVKCLSALGVFDLDPDGNHAVAPLVVTCWPNRRTALI